ncbi:MAG TPA: hypothetical protein VF778_02885 [Xanthobacteraceae bacterium]
MSDRRKNPLTLLGNAAISMMATGRAEAPARSITLARNAMHDAQYTLLDFVVS